MGRAPRLAGYLAALAVLAAGCNSEVDPAPESLTTSQSPAPESAAPTTGLQPGPVDVDRLLVIDAAGNVATLNPDGSDLRPLTDDASTAAYFQPTWSPTANEVAVSRFDGEAFSLVRVDVPSGDLTEVPVQSNAFYVYWSPDGKQLGYLSNGATSIELKLLDFNAGEDAAMIDVGQPFYFAWSPDSGQLATLIGQQRLDVRDATAGSPAVEIAMPGAFLNPVWTDAGIFYISTDDGMDQLVLGTPGGQSAVLARSPGAAVIAAPSSGQRVAVQATGAATGVEATLRQAPLLPLNQLVVIETASGEVSQVTDRPALAFFWDPAGDQLLVLDEDAEARQLRWSIWSDGELRALTNFLPSRAYMSSFLPFFGQYALSTTMWAPDGSAFAFAGLVEERGGVYVQDAAGGTPDFIIEGSWVTWSPI